MTDFKEMACRRCGHVWKWSLDKKSTPFCPEGYGCNAEKPDYSNWREWKEVELWEEEIYFQEHEEYSPKDVKDICDFLLQKGEDNGLQGCYLKFRSNTEPYEDWLGPPSVCVVGYRKLNSLEQKEIREDDAVREMAKELNITEYEARMLKQLKDKGVV